MPYSARKHQLNQSLLYHVYNRSNARVAVFHSDADYCYFMYLLKSYFSAFDVKCYHWVIMSNHYHLLIEIGQPQGISKLMAGLNRAYTCYHHRTYLTAGFLWQGRFKLQPVQKETYLITCARYIERNPVRAHIVREADEYSYSSAKFYCLGKIDGITTENPLSNTFGKEAVQRRIAYKQFLRNFNEEKERLFVKLEAPLGSREFINRLFKEDGRYIPKRRGRPKQRIVS